MKLELKHIAPYLPYNIDYACSVYDGDELEYNGKCKLKLIDWLGDCIVVDTPTEYELFELQISDIKPILRPLSELTKEYINKYEVSFIEHIYNESWMAMGYAITKSEHNTYTITSNEDGSEIRISTIKPHTNMWWVTQEMFKWEFDVFGLIDAGLAININTI